MNENQLTQKQFKAFLRMLKRDLTRIEQINDEQTLKEELRQTIDMVQQIIED